MLISLGQPYFYNDATKKSTYTRPLPALQPVEQYPNRATSVTSGLSQNGDGANFSTNAISLTPGGLGNYAYGNWNAWHGRGNSSGGFSNHNGCQTKDRSKSKLDIPGCESWVLVKTKLGRRFVYNKDKNQSFWRIPSDVMSGVNELDKQEQERQTRPDTKELSTVADDAQAATETEPVRAVDGNPRASPAPDPSLSITQETDRPTLDSDGEEYEEVEVTDDESEENPSKRQKTEDEIVEHPVEFNEEDIEFQLAAMGQSYGLDPGEYGDGNGEELEEGAEGLDLTEEDAKALFRDMLNDHGISPYTTWENIIETGFLVEDERYTVLPNMRSRKEAWGEWSRDTIQRLKQQREKEEKRDPKIPYLAFLQKNATPKLYWPEFRRKFKKEPEMHNNQISDKDREKWYRDYVSRLKLPEATLKSDMVKLLKSTPLYALNKSTTIDALPTALLTDLCYISLRPDTRDPLIEAHISTLPAAPADSKVSPEDQEAQAKERQQRQHRQEALAERQRQVQEEKRRQSSALRYSRDTLREHEEEVQRAMKVGKEGLLGHMAAEKE